MSPVAAPDMGERGPRIGMAGEFPEFDDIAAAFAGGGQCM
jgi:hypothetical protein